MWCFQLFLERSCFEVLVQWLFHWRRSFTILRRSCKWAIPEFSQARVGNLANLDLVIIVKCVISRPCTFWQSLPWSYLVISCKVNFRAFPWSTRPCLNRMTGKKKKKCVSSRRMKAEHSHALHLFSWWLIMWTMLPSVCNLVICLFQLNVYFTL